jgi:hypothetical protein
MGTSGAYGGSPGFKPVDDSTQGWLDAGGGGAGSGDANTPPAPPITPTPVDTTPPAAPSISPNLAGLLAALGRALASSGSGGSGGEGGGAGGGGRSVGGSGGRRSAVRATSVGGRAIGGAYGTRAGAAGPVEELGLTLADLDGLPRFQQAQRILEAALGPTGDVFDSELRQANAEVVMWALMEPDEPTPAALAERWVVEYVWQVWITEEGPTLQAHIAPGYDRERAEQEVRAALEATVAIRGLPTDRSVTTADFTAAIERALSSLRRITGSDAA